jgi:hypothetical protein
LHCGQPISEHRQLSDGSVELPTRERLKLPPLYEVDAVIATCQRAGFDASMARLAIRYAPTAGHGQLKLMLRFAR